MNAQTKESRIKSRLDGILPAHVTYCIRCALILVFLAMIGVTVLLAVPFVLRKTIEWSEMNVILLIGTCTILVGVMFHACLASSVRGAILFFALAFTISLACEYTGVHWGIPFGAQYHYHPDITPRLFDTVPVFIPLAWVVIAYGPLVLMRQIGRSKRSRLRSPIWRIVICSAGLVSADLFLDPLATAVHAWTWHRGGVYFGVPLSNFFGWFVVGVLIYTPYFCICERTHLEHNYRKAFYDGCYVASSCVLLCLAMVAVWLRLRSVVPIVAAAVTFTPMIAYWYTRTIPGSGLATRIARMFDLAKELE